MYEHINSLLAQLVKYDVHTTRKINSIHAIFYHILSLYLNDMHDSDCGPQHGDTIAKQQRLCESQSVLPSHSSVTHGYSAYLFFVVLSSELMFSGRSSIQEVAELILGTWLNVTA